METDVYSDYISNGKLLIYIYKTNSGGFILQFFLSVFSVVL